MMRYLVVLHQDQAGGYGVTVPDLPGCYSAGDTLADALEQVQEAIALHVETLVAHRLPVPAPAGEVDPEGGIVAVVDVDDGLLSERAVRVNITFPSRLLAVMDRHAKRAEGGRSGLLAAAVRAYLARGSD